MSDRYRRIFFTNSNIERSLNIPSVAVAVLENLGLLELLIPNQEWRSSDQVLQQMAMLALAHAWDIKAALNITVSDKDTPIAIAQKLLGKVGLKLEYLRREGSDGERMRVYGSTTPSDGRDEVFTAWMVRDEATTVNFTSTPGNKEIINSSMDLTELEAGVEVKSVLTSESKPVLEPSPCGS